MSRIKQAHPVPLENVTTFRDIEDEVTDFVRNGFKRGFTVGLHNFDKIFSTTLIKYLVRILSSLLQ
jgi:twinkle protein